MIDDRDIHNIESRYQKEIENLPKNEYISAENREIIIRYLREAALGKTITKGQKKKIGMGRLLRCSTMLKSMDKDWFKKPFDKVDDKDMERFIELLDNGLIKSRKGTPFTSESKKTIKKFIRKFYKWLLGENEYYPKIVRWIDTSEENREVPALTRDEIERIVNRVSRPMIKALIMVLFDGGLRIGECLNLKLDDIKVKKEGVKELQPYNASFQEKDYYLIRIRISKTKSRTISLTLCTKYLKDWIHEHQKTENPESFLFLTKWKGGYRPINYHNVCNLIRRSGNKILNKHVTPHMLRHSSATYYANIINRYQLCYRYGWSMSSDMPDRYIDRNGIQEQETAEIMKTDEITKFQRENTKLNEEINLLKEQNRVEIEQLKQAFENRFNMIQEMINNGVIKIDSKNINKNTSKKNPD